MEVVDFLLPLYAGASMGLTPSQIGALVAVELVATMAIRPLAGWLTDTAHRTHVAACGAGLYGLICVGYAVAQGSLALYAAAIVGGVGGAFTWVAVRAMVAEHLREESATFAELLRAQSIGPLVFHPVAIVITEAAGYRAGFIAAAIVCLIASALLLLSPLAEQTEVEATARASSRSIRRRMAPLLLASLVTSASEAGVGLVLLLHLQRAFDLDVWQIAVVFLPGGLALIIVPVYLHHLVLAWGRRVMILAATLASALFAATLAVAPNPVIISGLWVLRACAWATLGPIEDAVIAETTRDRLGQGMSLSGMVALGGAAMGASIAGMVYEGGRWQLACLAFAFIIAASGILSLWALRRVGAADRPPARSVGSP